MITKERAVKGKAIPNKFYRKIVPYATAKCPYCKEVNHWPKGTNCKHYTGHEVDLQTLEQIFFFIKDKDIK